MSIFKTFFDSNEKQIKKLKPVIETINSLEPQMEKLTPEQISEKTNNWRGQLKNIDAKDSEKYLNDILPEAFALVRESGKRVLKMRHFDVQLMAGVALHQGKISE